ncbi:nucleotide-diphospho-sugar transferase [Aspergillus caelatus]|uniref:Nucleotide-diphospho-sugar transferase n=2 Tax=Aspergillus subgen. Circumdati TaxID=2720871 RepID=A0A5N7A4J9_9EURO|nr:nucleotide-diphospho-sugar transferase [Aspergillus caelatus]KAE8364119.1 nucleotide-diphospho-sugar transferase [Aspergillus caelatus]KAE8416451.1 nucleotide-diphospho-sugar transferase [Aspergillus pseudocaelatus]
MTSSMSGVCLPRQIRRIIPGCLAAILFVSYLSITDTFGELSDGLSYRSCETHRFFPKKIWQSWKVAPFEFEERDLAVARSWTSKNPSYRYEVLTDQNDLYYVETHFGPDGFNRPDIVDTYRSLTAQIIKADLLRYLIMYVDGGVWADIDVEALRPIDRFIPERYDEHDIDIVIGVEIDEPDFNDHPILGQKSQSFCQWTFMAKPRQPVMMRLVNHILEWLNELSVKQGKPIAELELDFDDIISGTGPSAFTSAVLAEMSINAGHEVTWKTFHNIPESKLVGGFLVLTVEAFAAGQGHSDSGNHNSRSALIKHHYHASGWPSKHPRYNHPVYGEVERCNWNKDCVAQWDSNTAAFAALSPEEQEHQIALKRALDGEANPVQDQTAWVNPEPDPEWPQPEWQPEWQ